MYVYVQHCMPEGAVTSQTSLQNDFCSYVIERNTYLVNASVC